MYKIFADGVLFTTASNAAGAKSVKESLLSRGAKNIELKREKTKRTFLQRHAMKVKRAGKIKKNPVKKKSAKLSRKINDWFIDRFKNGHWEPVAAFKHDKKKEAIEYAKAYANAHKVKIKVYQQ